MGYLERNSETWKNPGFSGFECRVSGIGRVSIFGFGSGSDRARQGYIPHNIPILSQVRVRIGPGSTSPPASEKAGCIACRGDDVGCNAMPCDAMQCDARLCMIFII